MRRTYPAWSATLRPGAALSCRRREAQEARGAAPPAQGRGGGRGPQAPAVVSPEVMADRRVAFRIYAPHADAVRLGAGDIQGLGQATQLTKGENGVWELTIGPIDPGAYRYNLNVDGVTTIDPRNPATSESNNNVWSLFVVPGLGLHGHEARAARRGRGGHVLFDGARARSGACRSTRRPGTNRAAPSIPCSISCTAPGTATMRGRSVGRAGFILDNLIADGKAKPMIVVMPAGHTRKTTGGGGGGGSSPDAPRTKSS